MTAIKDKPGLDATTIKILAVILMFIDHIHQMWAHAGAPIWLTCLGRPVFPLFMFIMAESFHYTRSRKALLIRLLIVGELMAAISFALQYILPNPEIQLINSAFRTFFMAALYMLFFEIIKNGVKTKNAGKTVCGILLCFVPVLASLPLLLVTGMETMPLWLFRLLYLLPNVFLLEGGAPMALLGISFYIFRKWRWAQIAFLTAFSLVVFVLSKGANIQWMMVFAAVPMLLYNGEKGRGMKRFFYVFYPAHIYLLYTIATLWK